MLTNGLPVCMLALLACLLAPMRSVAATLHWLDGNTDKALALPTVSVCTLVVTPSSSVGPIGGIHFLWKGNGHLDLATPLGHSHNSYNANREATAEELADATSGRQQLDLGEVNGGTPFNVIITVMSGSTFSITAIEVDNGRALQWPLQSQPIATINAGLGMPARPEPLSIGLNQTQDSVMIRVRGLGLELTERCLLLFEARTSESLPFSLFGDTAAQVTLPLQTFGRAEMLRFEGPAGSGAAIALDPTGVVGDATPHQLLAILDPATSASQLPGGPAILSITPVGASPELYGSPADGRFEDLSKIVIIDVDPAYSLSSTLNAVREMTGIASADSVSAGMQLHSFPDDVKWNEQWNLHPITQTLCQGYVETDPTSGINVIEAWTLPPFATPVRVAIIDSGIDASHVDIPSEDPNEPWVSFAWDDSSPFSDIVNHGTPVASIATGVTNNYNGTASASREALPVSLKWQGDDGFGNLSTIIACIGYFAGRPGIPIANISAGQKGANDTELRAINQVCKNAFLLDHMIVASAGNGHDSLLCYPAAVNDFVTAVGATLWNNNYWTDFLAYAPSSDSLHGTTFGSWVDLYAPGGIGITAASHGDPRFSNQYYFSLEDPNPLRRCDFGAYGLADPGRLGFTGTSAAAPHVAGSAAWLKMVQPALSCEDVGEVLKRTATDMGAPGFDVFYGNGRVNVGAATEYVTRNWLVHGSLGPGTTGPLDILADSLTTAYLTLTNFTFGNQVFNGTYPCVRYHLAEVGYFNADYVGPPAVWARRAMTRGLPNVEAWDDDAQAPWAGVQLVTAQQALFDTYVYRLTSADNVFYPCNTDEAKIEYTAMGISNTLGVPASGVSRKLSLQPVTNPSRAKTEFEADAVMGGPLRVEVFDISGRRLATLFEGMHAGGKVRFAWDGRNEGGTSCRSGIYFCRIEQPLGRGACRFAYLR